MTTTLSTLIHNQTECIAVDRARRWMLRSQEHYTDEAGVLDTEALAKQADREFGIGLDEARRLAGEVVEMKPVKIIR